MTTDRPLYPAPPPMQATFDTVIKRLLFALGVLLLVLIAFTAKFDFLGDVNAIDYAQIARNLSEGKGFTTSVTTPLTLSLGLKPEHAPDLSRPPLYVGALALAMRIAGASDRTVAFVAVVFLLLTLLAVYLVGRSFFGETIAINAVALTALSSGLLLQALTGLETPLLALLITALFGLLLRHHTSTERPTIWWPLLAGLLLGLCYLVRFECLALLPAVLLYWLWASKSGRWARIALTLVAFLVVAAPWVIRTNRIVGRTPASTQSYELLMQTVQYPGQTLYRQFTDVPRLPLSFVVDHPLQMARKLNEGVRAAYAELPQFLNPYVLVFFVLAFFIGETRRRYAPVLWTLVASILLLVAGMTFYSSVLRLLLAFVPLVVIVATAGFIACVDNIAEARWGAEAVVLVRRVRTVSLLLWMLVVAYPVADYLFATPPTRQAAMVAALQEVGKQGRLVCTDIPWHVAWHGHTHTLLLPQSPQQLQALRQDAVRPQALYLSPNLLSMPGSENLGGWQQLLLRGETLPGYARDGAWRSAGLLLKSQGGKATP